MTQTSNMDFQDSGENKSYTVLTQLEELKKKRPEWTAFRSPSVLSLTSQDKNEIKKMLNKAMELAFMDERNNPLYCDNGLFTHLFGMRDERFPMGIRVCADLGVEKEKDSSSTICVIFYLSSPTYWGKGYLKNRWLKSMEMSEIKKATRDQEFLNSWNEKILKELEKEIKIVRQWEFVMTQHGFYVLPTGFESFLPIGQDGGLFCCLNMTGTISVQYADLEQFSKERYDSVQNVPKLVRRLMNESNALKIMTGLPEQLKEAMAGV